MAISTRQKKIINPYAETTVSQGADGRGYSYSSNRNKFVLDAIQESFLSFYKFPSEGTILNISEWTDDEKTISKQDLEAYCALYPQNGRYDNSQIKMLSDQQAEDRLSSVVIGKLRDNNSLDKYSSPTSELTHLPEYEEKQRIANLIAISSDHSRAYRGRLRASLRLPSVQDSPELGLDLLPLDPIVSVYVGSDTNVDIYDWRNNCKPGTPPEKVYYNPSDSHYYFTKRTEFADPSAYALNYLLHRIVELGAQEQNAEQTQEYRQSMWGNLPDDDQRKINWTEAYNEGISQILLLTGKNSENNAGLVKQRVGIPPNAVLSYKDVRPGSRWMYAVRIPAAIINSLPDGDMTALPSYEDLELSPLEKAKRIVGNVNEGVPQNTSTIRYAYRAEELLQYLPTVRLMLREYNEKLELLGIGPADISGIDLEKEVDRLTSFMDFLALFCSYNKISLEDEDKIEFFFGDQYILDHICINGVFYDRGCANTTYSNQITQGVSLINAFSLMTPTTFSIIKNAFDIQLEYIQTTTSTRSDVLDFLSQFVFPTIDVDSIKATQMTQDSTIRQKEEKRRHLFQELSRITQTSPAEYELLFSNRSLTYKISSTLTGVNCDTGQAKAAKYALKFYQAATGKTKLQSLIRETILLIRNELIRDLVEREVISRDTASYANDAARIAAMNPEQIFKQVEMFVDQQVFCSLDILGDFIQDSFLDPLDVPPVANSLVRKTLDVPNLKINFKKQKMVSLKADTSEVYRRAIKTLIYNFLKSLVAGVAKDIVEALLGCGPDGKKGDKATDLAAAAKRYDYGYSDLETLLETVDIVSIAKKAGLVNVLPNGTIRDPSLNQINQILSDTSKMCTPIELQQLLDGDSPNELLEHLLENYTSNRRLSYASTKVDDETIYEELDSRVYSEIDFSVEKIVDFFDKLGNTLDGTASVGELPYNSPLEVYCASKEPYTSPLTLEFPQPGEIENQYMAIADSRINKINDLCGWLRGMENVQNELERLISNLPIMTWYTDFLEFLQWLSDKVADFLGGLWSKLWDKPPLDTTMLPYNMYHSKMGVELFYQIFLELRNLPISEIRTTWQPPGKNLRFPVFATPPGYGSVAQLDKRGARSDNEVDGSATIGSAFIRTGIEHPDVNSFIWSHRQYEGNAQDIAASKRGPIRLRLPQYIMPIQRTYEAWDTAYYSMRNAPRPLTYDLKRGFKDPIKSARTDNQRDTLSHNAEKVLDYLVAERTDAPYVGYAGYNWLSCWEDDLGGIRIHFRENPTQTNLPLLAAYRPMRVNSPHYETTNYRIGVEGNLEGIDYKIFNYNREPLEFEGQTIRITGDNKLQINDVTLPVLSDSAVKRLYGNFSIGNETENPENRQIPSTERPRQLRGLNNYGERFDTTINNVITTNIGKRRLPRYISAINKPCLKQTDDDCVTREDIKRASAGIRSVQSRIQKFLVNVLPCARLYGAWGSVGTTVLVVDYLHRKIVKELQERQILGTFGESVKFIKEVYPHDPAEAGFDSNPIILVENSVEQNLKNIIEAVFRGMLKNIDKHSEYFVSDSVFAGNSGINYRYTLSKYYQAMKRDLENFDNNNRGYGIAAQNRQQTIQMLENLIENEEDVTSLGLMVGAYYMPIAFQIASYLIYYDHGIKFGDRYSDTFYRAQVEIAHADDGLISAIARREINRFSNLYVGYPASVAMWDRPRDIRYYNQNQVEQRIITLDSIIQNMFDQSRRFVTVPEILEIQNEGGQGQAVQLLNEYLQSIRVGLQPGQGSPFDFVVPYDSPRPQQPDVAYGPPGANRQIVFGNLPDFITRMIDSPATRLSTWRNYATNSANDWSRDSQILGTQIGLTSYPAWTNHGDGRYTFPTDQQVAEFWSNNEDMIMYSVELEIRNLLQDYLTWVGGTTERYNLNILAGGVNTFSSNIEDLLQRSRISGYNQIIPTEFTAQEYYSTLAQLSSVWGLAGASTWSSLDSDFIEGDQIFFDNGQLVDYRGMSFLADQIMYNKSLIYHAEAAGAGGGGGVTDTQLLARAIDWWVATAATGFFLTFVDTQYASWGNINNASLMRTEERVLKGLINTNE